MNDEEFRCENCKFYTDHPRWASKMCSKILSMEISKVSPRINHLGTVHKDVCLVVPHDFLCKLWRPL